MFSELALVPPQVYVSPPTFQLIEKEVSPFRALQTKVAGSPLATDTSPISPLRVDSTVERKCYNAGIGQNYILNSHLSFEQQF